MEMFDYNSLIEDRHNRSPPVYDDEDDDDENNVGEFDDIGGGASPVYRPMIGMMMGVNSNRSPNHRPSPLPYHNINNNNNNKPSLATNRPRPRNQLQNQRHPHFRYTPQRTILKKVDKSRNRSLPSIVIDPELHPDSYPLYRQQQRDPRRQRRPYSCSPYRLPPPSTSRLAMMMQQKSLNNDAIRNRGRRSASVMMPDDDDDEELQFAHYDQRRPSELLPQGPIQPLDDQLDNSDEVDPDYHRYLKYQQQQNASYLDDDGVEFGDVNDDEREIIDANDDDDIMINSQVRKEPFAGQVGIYGWRKKITYLLLVIIVLMVVVNFALTFWIVSFLGFSSNGISGLDLSFDVISFNGDAIFKNILYARDIRSYQDQSLKFGTKDSDISFQSEWTTISESDQLKKFSAEKNISESLENNEKVVDSKLTLSKNSVRLETDNFEIYDRFNRKVFALNSLNNENSSGPHSQITITADNLKFQNLNGLRIPMSIQTSLIESSTVEELKILSPQSRLLIRAPKSVAIQSKLGDMSMITYDDLVLRANRGRIVLETGKSFYLRNLAQLNSDGNEVGSMSMTNNGTTKPISRLASLRPKPEIFQLCICETGKVFLANADSICAVQNSKDCN